jgi:hypothetical protein
VKVTYANYVHFHTRLEMCSPHIPIENNVTITGLVCIHLVGVGYVLVSIDEYVGVGVTPNKRPILTERQGN